MDDDGKDLERVALIDVFSEDDVLISSSPAAPNPSGHSEANRSPVECQAKCRMRVDRLSIPADSPELKHGTSCKYNLRKSLAWDSAFFTSEGVLDPEELADVNSTFKDVEKCVLPRIQEDTRKSVESNSTLGSDSWVVENAEVGLFENLQASIQKSQRKHDKDSSLTHSSSTLSSGKIDVTDNGRKIDFIANSALMNRHLSFQVKMEPSGVSKKHVLSGQHMVEMSKETANRPQAAANDSGQKKLPLRTTRTASRLPIAPNRRPTTFESVQPKTKNEVLLVSSNVGNNQPLTAKKKLISRDSHNVTPTTTTSVKVSSSSIKLHPIASCSDGRSGGTSCDHMGKSHLESLNKKTSRKIDQSSLKSDNIYPLSDSKSRYGDRNAKSTLKFSSSISPNSSIDSLASEESSSSTSTIKKPTNSPSTLELRLCDTLHDNSKKVPKGEWVDTGSSRTHLLTMFSSADAPRCHISSSEEEFKPSGLRLPSPKIGYFDKEKPQPHISNIYSPQCTQVSMIPKTSGLKNDAWAVKQRCSDPRLAASTKSDPPDLGNAHLPQAKGTRSSSLLQPSKTSAMSVNVRKVRNYYDNPNTQKDSSHKIIQKIALNPNNVGAEMSNVYQTSTKSAEAGEGSFEIKQGRMH